MLYLYLIGVVLAFLCLFLSEAHGKTEISLSYILMFLYISMGSWFIVAIWLFDEYKIDKKIGKLLDETKIPLKKVKKLFL